MKRLLIEALIVTVSLFECLPNQNINQTLYNLYRVNLFEQTFTNLFKLIADQNWQIDEQKK